MDRWAAILFLLIEVIAAFLVYRYWKKNRSELELAKQQLSESLRSHEDSGTLREFVEGVLSGQLSVFQKTKVSKLYLWTGAAMVGGVVITFLCRYLGFGLWVRAIVGILSVLPFVALISIGIAEESDGIRITNFQTATARELLSELEQPFFEDSIADPATH